MRRGMCVIAVLVLLGAGTACSNNDDGRAGAEGTDRTTTTAASTTTKPAFLSNADALKAAGSKQIDPSPSDPVAPGATRVTYEVGPIDVKPGQNNIDFVGRVPKPNVDGWIVRMAPNIRRADGTVPPVDVIHLHHGVWLNFSRRDLTSPGLPERFMAAGEEKTIYTSPPGYAYKFQKNDQWTINYMLHNLWPKSEKVWITYTLDFIPATAPQAKDIKEATPLWMDVKNGSVYPVFDVMKGSGKNGQFTFPDDATDPYKGGKPVNRFTLPTDGTLIGTGGHLHPGGLRDDLWVERKGARPSAAVTTKQGRPDTARLFSSVAKYFEPAGAVSWDVSMTVTGPNYRVQLKKGDTLETTTTYDTRRGSWYESMGIMVSWFVKDGTGGADPFTTKVDTAGVLTHGHLAENNNHGGAPDPKDYVDLTKVASSPAPATVPIENFAYSRGDMSVADSVPTVKPGGTLTFENSIDAPLGNGIWHTITACKAPCNGATGIAYPLADGTFDSGQLGKAGSPTAGRLTWSIPTDLPPGTYTYFCRVHPFMRGAFRVAAG